MVDVTAIKQDFPILEKKIHGKQLVYLDNSATSHKPRPVLEALTNYYEEHNANIHRGVHQLSDESTQVWDDARMVVARFFGAQPHELIVTRNTTEALNGVAYGWGDHNLQPGDVILTSILEHHSNFVVWQELARRTGASLQFIEVDENGRLDAEDFTQKLEHYQVKLVALVHVSNALGTLNPIAELTKQLRTIRPEARIMVDGAQAAPHLPVSFESLGVDFYSFSGHKMLAPMGVGGLFVRSDVLQSGEMQPWLFGGGMIDQVHRDFTQYHEDYRELFTAGTPDVASMVGLAAACEYLDDVVGGMQLAADHDRALVEYALEQLQTLPEVQLVGPITPLADSQLDRVGSVTFVYQGVHAHDVAQVLDSQGVAVRSGHHCTMPLHTHFKWQATVRASFQVYNDTHDIDVLVSALAKVASIFG